MIFPCFALRKYSKAIFVYWMVSLIDLIYFFLLPVIWNALTSILCHCNESRIFSEAPCSQHQTWKPVITLGVTCNKQLMFIFWIIWSSAPVGLRQVNRTLTPLSLDSMATISQRIFSDAFSWMKNFVFWLEIYWRLFPRVQFIIIQH